MSSIELKPIKQQTITLVIKGKSPIIMHQWSEKALREMREKHAGKKTKNRDIRDPAAESDAAMYRTADGTPGIPAMAFKSSLIGAAHKDIGLEKTLLRKALFLNVSDGNAVLPFLDNSEPFTREDCVRVGAGSTDLRYRPQFDSWRVKLTMEFDAEMLRAEDVVNLINRAGYGVGICEWRPEKGGEFGRFEVDASEPVEVK